MLDRVCVSNALQGLSSVQGVSIDYQEFCECIYHREQISDRLGVLSSLFVQWQDEHATTKRRSSDDASLPPWLTRLQERYKAADSCIAWNFHQPDQEASQGIVPTTTITNNNNCQYRVWLMTEYQWL
jgi:hypothetical protein